MLNYRRLCSYSETEKWLVISALEVKYFSNGTCDAAASLHIFRLKRETDKKLWLGASMLAGGEERTPESEGCLCHCPMPSLLLSLSSKNAQVGKSSQCQPPSLVSLHLVLGESIFYWPCSFMIQLDEPQGTSCLCFPSTEITNMGCCAWFSVLVFRWC